MKYKQKRYFFPLILLGINLFFTTSRTGILCTSVFLFLFFITTPNIKIRYKILILIICTILCGVAIKIVYEQYPDIVEKIEKVFIRPKSIKSFTGRADIWQIGIDLVNKDNKTLMFGVGRFVGVKALDVVKYGNITQFHNFYIDMLVTGGIMELVYLISIYIFIMVKILKSQMNGTFKAIYISVFISYALYCFFESLGRFSIGCADTVCLVSFVSIPLLHANSIHEKKKIVLKRIEFEADKEEIESQNIINDEKEKGEF